MTKRVAIVTGSSQGIGKAIVQRLAADKFAVCVNDIHLNSAGIDSLVAELNDKYGKGTALGQVADVTKADQVSSMIQETVKQLGPLTVMIANAGIAGVSPTLELTEEEVRRIMDVNFMGVWHCYTLAAKQMIAQGPVSEGGGGYRILAAASIAAFRPSVMMSHYTASKWAVRGFTQAFAKEMGPHAITVNAYAPGVVSTPMIEMIDGKLGARAGLAKGEMVEKYSQENTALQRLSVPEDVSKVVAGFLCSDDSSFVTGQTIIVDGGIVFA